MFKVLCDLFWNFQGLKEEYWFYIEERNFIVAVANAPDTGDYVQTKLLQLLINIFAVNVMLSHTFWICDKKSTSAKYMIQCILNSFPRVWYFKSRARYKLHVFHFIYSHFLPKKSFNFVRKFEQCEVVYLNLTLEANCPNYYNSNAINAVIMDHICLPTNLKY